ncbi:unnamed protein product [Spirodela intermedia]|uniref:Phytocyanin domain-containing protein n=1 Tax=Spirodela intermedia TaxID=51605 RepID=A0A7I8JB87_SPIIN|nr:unnamed protein product [Spirodela intermedia]CAA6666985.1 unnamed protein product [Spirodela intermedia]
MAGLLALVLLFLAVASVPALATNHDITWVTGVDYTGWASEKSITVGDTITFQYGGSHTVDEVTKADYESCSSSASLRSSTDGNTVILLDEEKTRYFICATGGHCLGGMKIAITISAASTTPPRLPPPLHRPTPPRPPGAPRRSLPPQRTRQPRRRAPGRTAATPSPSRRGT